MTFLGVLPLFRLERILSKADRGHRVVRVEIQGAAMAVVVAAADVYGTVTIQKLIQFAINITHIVYPLFCSAVLSLKHAYIIKQTPCNFYKILVIFHDYYRFLVAIAGMIRYTVGESKLQQREDGAWNNANAFLIFAF